MRTFLFIRNCDKLAEEWNGEKRSNILDMRLNCLDQERPDSKNLRLAVKTFKKAISMSGGWNKPMAKEAVAEFFNTVKKYKRQFHAELENAKMRRYLELIYPFEAARYAARGMKTDNPLALTRGINEILEGPDNIENEYKDLEKLVLILTKINGLLKEGEPVSRKLMKKYNDLRISLGFRGDKRFSV